MAEQSFTTMAGPKATREAPEIGVGMLGYAFMGKAHSNAYKKIPYMMYPPPAIPRLVAICGRNEEAVAEAARRYGYEKVYTDWREMLEDDRRCSSSTTAAPTTRTPSRASPPRRRASTSSARSRWRRTAEEAKAMLDAVDEGGRQAHGGLQLPLRARPSARPTSLIESGKLGRIYHFRARLPAGVDHAALRHADDLAHRQGDGRQRRARRPGCAHHRPGPLPGGRDQDA